MRVCKLVVEPEKIGLKDVERCWKMLKDVERCWKMIMRLEMALIFCCELIGAERTQRWIFSGPSVIGIFLDPFISGKKIAMEMSHYQWRIILALFENSYCILLENHGLSSFYHHFPIKHIKDRHGNGLILPAEVLKTWHQNSPMIMWCLEDVLCLGCLAVSSEWGARTTMKKNCGNQTWLARKSHLNEGFQVFFIGKSSASGTCSKYFPLPCFSLLLLFQDSTRLVRVLVDCAYRPSPSKSGWRMARAIPSPQLCLQMLNAAPNNFSNFLSARFATSMDLRGSN